MANLVDDREPHGRGEESVLGEAVVPIVRSALSAVITRSDSTPAPSLATSCRTGRGRGFFTAEKLLVVRHPRLQQILNGALGMSSRVLHGTGVPVAGYLGSLICREARLAGENLPAGVGTFPLGGGCPGVFGPNPSAGLDECADSRRRITPPQASGLAFPLPHTSNAPLH